MTLHTLLFYLTVRCYANAIWNTARNQRSAHTELLAGNGCIVHTHTTYTIPSTRNEAHAHVDKCLQFMLYLLCAQLYTIDFSARDFVWNMWNMWKGFFSYLLYGLYEALQYWLYISTMLSELCARRRSAEREQHVRNAHSEESAFIHANTDVHTKRKSQPASTARKTIVHHNALGAMKLRPNGGN